MTTGTTPFAAPFNLEEGLAVLERTPATLKAMLSGLPEAWTGASEGPDTWSPFDVVGHLIDGEETDWMGRARIILAGGPDNRFVPFDRFRHQDRNRGRGLNELLSELTELRARNLAELRALELTDEQLGQTGIHPRFGTVTLRQLLATWVAHDLDHVIQIARVMARRYTDAVGPWSFYLRVINTPIVPGN